MVENITYKYNLTGPVVLKNLSFKVAQGEIVALMGLSGCGKSTLCYCLNGIIPHCWDGVLEGRILVNGKDTKEFTVASLAQEVGLVFQDPDTQLFSPTVEDEIAFAPENMCLPRELIRERVDEIINLLGIESLRIANPCQLSGGEKHLVALAAVLALDPPVLVLDEVMSQLDYSGKKKVADALEKLRRQGKTIIAVEHDLETVAMADRMMIMENGKLIKFDRREKIMADQEFLAACRLI
ncbi:MAG: energy-coupling factor ABC transporter ATP-binding protein [Syntrophomonadaceae bacterium]